jgi:4-aminobutyrate--pyruvate transaminase
VSPILQSGLERFSDHSLVGEVRGVGLLGALELVRDKSNKDPFDLVQGVGQYLVKRCQENGLITRALGDTLAFSPPLIINKNEISRMLNIVEISLDETAAWIDQNPPPI